jgi:hypothetical protein
MGMWSEIILVSLKNRYKKEIMPYQLIQLRCYEYIIFWKLGIVVSLCCLNEVYTGEQTDSPFCEGIHRDGGQNACKQKV